MDNESISRAALGNVVSLGTLYDARSDKFCRRSIFKKRIPPEALTLMDADSSDIQLVYSDDFAEKFHNLKVEAELQVSILGGLFSVVGCGEYLSDQKKSSRIIKSSLIYNVRTKEESVNIYHEDLKEAFAIDAVQTGAATHVVVGISWGVNSVLTCSYKNRENRDLKEISGNLSAHLKKASLSISGEASVDLEEGESGTGTSYDIRMFGDMLPRKEDLPTTTKGALALMKQMPSLVAGCNEGKGKPLTYTLLPLRELQDYLQFQSKADTVVKTLEKESLLRVVKLFDSIAKAQQRLHDFCEDASESQFCVRDVDMERITHLKNEAELEEARFRSKLSKTLVKVRSGQAEVVAVEDLIKEFQESEYSPGKITSKLESLEGIMERVNFAKALVAKGVTYIGFRKSLDEEILKRLDDNAYVLYFNINSKTEDPHRWAKNRQLFFVELANQLEGSGCRFYVVDCDIHPGLMPKNCSSCVQVIKSLKVITEDLLADNEACASIPLAKLVTGTVKLLHKPKNLHPFKIRCTGNSCDPAAEYRWKCSKCKFHLEWGLDNHVYCQCGKTPVKLIEFKCPHPDHGVVFEKHEDYYLTELLRNIAPRPNISWNTKPGVINLLILGETGVGKSTWINAFNNVVNYETLDDAEFGELRTLIPSRFTTYNNNFEEITVKTKTANSEFEEVSEDCPCRIYRIKVGNDTTIQFVDTPGNGEPRGMEQDKNFQHIFTSISHLRKLHGICILLKPNSGLTPMLRYFIKELLANLHRDAAKNIVFCFTNSRATFLRPGDSLPALKHLLEVETAVEIPVSKDTVYCFDSEAYRYLAAIKNEEPVTFDEDEKLSLIKSWEKSSSETQRLLIHIEALPAHSIESTLNFRYTRETIVKLIQPLVYSFSNLLHNKGVIEDKKNNVENMSHHEFLMSPYMEDTMSKADWLKCPRPFEIKQKILEGWRMEIEEYEHELQKILQASVKFAYYLKTNAITLYKDEMEQYLDHSRLMTSKEQYVLEKRVCEEAMRNGNDTTTLNAADIQELITGLKALKHSGVTLTKALNGSQINNLMRSMGSFFGKLFK